MNTPDGSDLTEVRLDRYLWAIRLFRTRSLASQICKGGHVKINGAGAKASHRVRQGDHVVINHDGITRVIEVVTPTDKRVGAPQAATCYIDHSPPVELTEKPEAPFLREASSGRPTKRDRRRLDRLRRNA